MPGIRRTRVTAPRNEIARCEAALARLLGRRHCVLFGSGTAALAAACSLADPARPGVLLPATACDNVAYAVAHSGRRAAFADVTARDATLDPAQAAARLGRDRGIGAIVAVHLFGHGADMKALRRLATRHRTLLIEDVAQALGGTLPDGRPFGAAGDVAILSFGYSKVLDLGWGGALLTDGAAWARRARAFAGTCPARPSQERAQVLSEAYRSLYFALHRAGKRDRRALEALGAMPGLLRDLHLNAMSSPQAGRIRRALPSFGAALARRQALAREYRRALEGTEGIGLFDVPADAPIWRMTFRVDAARRSHVLECVRARGFDVSSWYPCIADHAPRPAGAPACSFPVARRLERELVNTWLTPDYGTARVRKLCATIRSAVRRSTRPGGKR